MDTAIQKAQERITFVKSTKEDLHAYQMREMAMFDYTSGMNDARRKGIAEGRKEGMMEGIMRGMIKGKTEGKIEIAHIMKRSGIPTSQIIQFTGLTEAEINQL